MRDDEQGATKVEGTIEGWTPTSFRQRPNAQALRYDDERALADAIERLRVLPPLVTSWEVERLRAQLAEAEDGGRFVVQGGDCAETFADCRPDVLTGKVKILLQTSLLLVHATKKPVIRIGRFAGQYAKPRTQPLETRIVDGVAVTLPNYFGDLINHAAFDAASRRPDPALLVRAYEHAALTMNFVRSLADGGFADVRRVDQWDLSFMERGAARTEYEERRRELLAALSFAEALTESGLDVVGRTDLFSSHEALHLEYELAQTRTVPRRGGHYLLTTHFPWIGERTRRLDGAHVEYARGIQNPIGVKLGPDATADDVVAISEALNPQNQQGRLVFITRLGATKVEAKLPELVTAAARARRRALFICDPMHGNTQLTESGKKTRRFSDILAELKATIDVHERLGTVFGGVHFEMTGENVTECVGGAEGITEADLGENYTTACDPRLNYRQSLELTFAIAKRLSHGR